MQGFEYAQPKRKDEAVRLLADEWGPTEILAGGTDLLSFMKDDLASPKRLVDLKGVKELGGIQYTTKTGLRLGALVTLEELLDHAEVRQSYPALAQAAAGVYSPQIRSRGTVGGDLCQRPRCWYYRSGFGLLARDASGKPLVPDGDNRYHAILGNGGPAYFVNPSSLAPALIALGASLRIMGPQGSRDLLLENFFVVPKTDAEREYALKPNEIVAEVLVPPASGIRSAAYEVRQREALDWPLAAAAVALKLDGKKVQGARVVLGHVAPIPWRSPEAERALIGKTVSEAVADAAGLSAVSRAQRLSRNGYKIQLARVAVKRAVLQAAGGA
ncbi:MAG: FAD binding domain-containing protein [Acidobacteria bacterium]|nr:FAD binding domain-containing protein [Acidobacteriota bacterium]MBI3657361.1 FAD binding domain-containing protein [Acidobacteriota bacterium]